MTPQAVNAFQRAAATPLTAGVRIARLCDLNAADLSAWAQLSNHSAADSVFSSDWFVRAILAHFDPDGAQQLFIAVDALGDWYGVAVLAPSHRLGRIPLAHWCGLSNPNQFLGVPLVRRGREAAFWRAMLPALDRLEGGRSALHLADVPADHRTLTALFDQCAADGRAIEQLGRHARAALLSSHALSDRMEAGLSSKRAARLRSLERKLERDHGAVQSVQAVDSDGITAWIDDFLVLEASGWKGRGGSALASSPDSAALFRETVSAAHARGAITCLSLSAGGQVIAMSSFFLSDGHGFGFKCCFDEAYASYAPGILLLRRIMAMVGAGPEIQFDSCSAPSEATINGLWPERRVMLELCVELRGPTARARFGGAMAARRAWHWWKKLTAPEAV